MSKPAEIEPRWLVSLLNVWARKGLYRERDEVGWYNQSAFLTVGRATTGHADPTSYCAQDFSELENALEDLRAANVRQLMALMMYYKPWGVQAAIAEGWPFQNTTYYDRLHAAHAYVAAHIDRQRRMGPQSTEIAEIIG